MPRPPDRRAKIELLRAAEAVFVERGLAAAKVEDITAQAGVSKGAFYLHFDSKDDCFRQIVEGLFARLVECIEASPSVPESDDLARAVQEHLETCLAHDVQIFEFCWQNRALLGMVLAGGGGAAYAYLASEFPTRVAAHVGQTLRELIRGRIFRPDLDAEVVPTLIAGAYEHLARMMIKQPKRPNIKALCEQALLLFSRGLMTDEARAIVDSKVNEERSESGLSGARSSHKDERGGRLRGHVGSEAATRRT